MYTPPPTHTHTHTYSFVLVMKMDYGEVRQARTKLLLGKGHHSRDLVLLGDVALERLGLVGRDQAHTPSQEKERWERWEGEDVHDHPWP